MPELGSHQLLKMESQRTLEARLDEEYLRLIMHLLTLASKHIILK